MLQLAVGHSKSRVANVLPVPCALKKTLFIVALLAALPEFHLLYIDRLAIRGLTGKIELSRKVDGRWIDSSAYETLPDPLNGEPFLKVSQFV